MKPKDKTSNKTSSISNAYLFQKRKGLKHKESPSVMNVEEAGEICKNRSMNE